VTSDAVARSALLLAVVAYGLFFVAWRRGAHRAAIVSLLVASFGLRFYAACDAFVHEWDERFHALVAKNLVANPLRPTLYVEPLLPYDYRNWLANHVWLHKPPLALWCMALSMAVFGVSELALRLPSLLLAVVAVGATYRLGVAWKGQNVGLAAAFLHSTNVLLIQLAAGRVGQDHVDAAHVAYIGLALAAVASSAAIRAFVCLGLLCGLAVLSKWAPGFLPIIVGAAWHWGRLGVRKTTLRAALALGVAIVVVAPWTFYAWRTFPAEFAWELEYNKRHFFEPLEGHGGSPLYHLLYIGRIYGELAYLPLLLFFVRLRHLAHDTRAWALAIWILVPYFVFSAAATKLPGYVLVAAPAVFLIEAELVCRLFENWGGGWVRRAATAVLCAGLLGLPLRIMLHDLKVFRSYERRPAWASEMRELSARLAGGRAVIFGCPRPIETMFYTSQVAYEVVPDRELVRSLQSRGYRVLFCDSATLPPDRRAWPDVEYIQPVESAGAVRRD
jgi:4-amino-4-deoxy-L-arabinose transferase